MKILLTAFEPFNGEKINPTMKLLEAIPDSSLLTKKLLPVSYARTFPNLLAELQNENYTDILMMGQAGGRALVSMERFALNWRDSRVADEDGATILEKPIRDKAPAAYRTNYPLRSWLSEAEGLQLPMEISNTAGAFICNSISFEIADHLQQTQQQKNWMFLHVPYLPEQISNKPAGTASMEFSKMLTCVEFILQKILAKKKINEER